MRRKSFKLVVSIVLKVLLTAATVFLWIALKQQDRLNQERITQTALDLVATRIRGQAETRFQSLRRMAGRWTASAPDRERWERDAALTYDASSFEAVEWIDADSNVLWSVPAKHTGQLKEMVPTSHPEILRTVNAARTERRLRITPPLKFASEKQGFLAFVPIWSKDRPVGYISGVFEAEEFFEAILEGIAPEYCIEVSTGSEKLYLRAGPPADNVIGIHQSVVRLGGSEWIVRVWPTPALLERAHSPLPTIVLFFSLLSALGASLTLYFALAKREDALDLKSVNQQLQRETEARERISEQLRLTQKMEAVGRLAAGVAHDFNNLLGVIIGHAELLLEGTDLKTPARKGIGEIQKAAGSAADLTRQLLAFSRQQMLEPRVLDMNQVVADAENLLRRLIHEDVELKMSLAPDPIRVKADPAQIEQVLMNLVVNARDAMPEGGMLTIETCSVELDASHAKTHPAAVPGRFVLLSVSDTGVGMDRETQAHIFEPFFSTKEKGKGTGLGLATVYGIVKQSEGFIWVYSEPLHGATFKVYLPQVFEPVEGLSTAHAPAVGGNETILLAEDEPGLRQLVGVMLRKGGYTVLEADSVVHAEELARQHSDPIHLLVTDVVMPGRSGKALAQEIARIRPDTKVLFISGYTDNAIVHHGVLEPGTAFLQKPFSKDALLRMVRSVLSKPSP